MANGLTGGLVNERARPRPEAGALYVGLDGVAVLVESVTRASVNYKRLGRRENCTISAFWDSFYLLELEG